MAGNGGVNTVLVEVGRGADPKLHPATPLSAEQRYRARQLAHNLCHRDHLSIRQAQQVMAESYGLRLSVGVNVQPTLWVTERTAATRSDSVLVRYSAAGHRLASGLAVR